MKNGLTPSMIVSFALAITVWAIFYPGALSVDSLSIFREARFGNFTDVRSPFITIMLALFLKLGGTIGLLTLIQCLLGFLGVRRLLLAITSLFLVTRERQEAIVSFGELLLSTPLSPMPIYFVTFWLDTWLALFLLWATALLIELAAGPQAVMTRENRVHIALLVALVTFVMLTRLNSHILYPALALAFIYVLWQRPISRLGIFVIAVLPLTFYLLFILFQYRGLGVKRAYQERNVFALDLASMLTYDPLICQTLSLHSCTVIIGRISPEFVVGNGAIDHTMNQGLRRMEPAYVQLANSPSLPQELWLAAKRFPLTYVTVKVLNFLDYLHPRPRYYFQSSVHPNSLDLSMNLQFAVVRIRYIALLHGVYSHPILKMLSFAHVTWIFVNLAGIVFCFVANRQSRAHTLLGMVLLVPFLYDLSYLIAMTASDFRFMYPSTLLVQVIAIGFIAGLSGQRITAKTSQAVV